jgi:GT2 family glycosyltransferase
MRLTAIVPATDGRPELAECVGAIRRGGPDELIVVDSPPGMNAAAARNAGAGRATGDVLVFIDSDVLVHPDAFARVRAAFERRPGLTAVFGSYDDSPRAAGTVSRFRNLLHHHVHHSSAGPASTFWTGLGAVRREALLAVGGFDESFTAMEDVELGMRLAGAGAAIELDPTIQATHLKGWSLRTMVATDLLRRGVPWVVELLRAGRTSSALNLGWRHRLSAGLSVAGAAAALSRRPRGVLAALAGLVALNASFYGLLLRRGGPRLAGAGVLLHAVHHLTSVASVPLGALVYARQRRAGPGLRPAASPRSAAIGDRRSAALQASASHDRIPRS